MPPVDGDQRLPDEVVAHVDFEADLVRRAAAAAVLATPVCAIGLTYVDGGTPTVDMAALLTARDRAQRFARDGEQALWSLCPSDWPTQLSDVLLRAEEGPRYRRAGHPRYPSRTTTSRSRPSTR